MSSEVESMMYVGEEPWHGLGKRLINPPTSEEAMKEADLDWTVKLHPITANKVKFNDYLAIMRETDNQLYGVVRPGWTPLQNVDAFKFFDPIVKAGLAEYHTAGSLKNGEKVWILAKIRRKSAEIVKKDFVDCYILLTNGHNGKWGVRVQFTPIRVVCWNTCTVAENSSVEKAIRIIHSAKVAKNLEDLRELIDVANQTFNLTFEQYKRFANTGIKNLEQYITRSFYPKKADIKSVGEDEITRTVSKVIQLYKNGRGSNIPGVSGSVWAAYNAVTEYVDHFRGREDTRLNQAWYGAGKTIKDTAFNEALKLAA